jgi:transcriptional regulator GlxA family with amidase domain
LSTPAVVAFGRERTSPLPRWAEMGVGGRGLALRAEAWLRQNLSEPPTIPLLCAALGTSERWLHEAFREHLHTTPKAYLKVLRLHAVRRDLVGCALGRRVTDVALDYGFLHFGWFSQDYRRLFGETPRQTLRRAHTARGVGAARRPWGGDVRARTLPLADQDIALGG